MDIEEARREEEEPIVRKPRTNKGKGKAEHNVFAPPENYSQIMDQYKQEEQMKKQPAAGGLNKGLAIFDFVLRLIAAVTAMVAAAKMATSDQTLPFFTQFLQFQAEYNDLTSFTFFVVANAIVGGYLVLSLPFSIVCIIRPFAVPPRLFLIIFDTAALGLNVAAAAAAAAIVYLAHNGNASANWLPVCQQFGDFCEATSGAVVASFIAAVLLIFLVLLSAVALKASN